MAKPLGGISLFMVGMSLLLCNCLLADCPQGDLDGNCRINIVDIQILADNWLDEVNCIDPSCGDLGGNPGVFFDDFAVLAARWGEICGLGVDTDMLLQDGYYLSHFSSIPLGGTANPDETGAVRVNGRLARWSPETGHWSIGPREGYSQTEELLPAGSSWLWLDDGSDQHGPADGNAWYGSLDYNDSAWSGPASGKFGYGGDGEITPVNSGPSSNKYITTYFRTWFDVEDASEFESLTARVLRDDGVVVYLNGNPLPAIRDRVSQEPFDYLTVADSPAVGGSDEDTYFEHNVDRSLLVNGSNLIAAEVHQVSRTSSDLGFDLQLAATRATSATDEPIALEPNENTIVIETFADANGQTTPLETSEIAVWYEQPVITTLSGTLAADTTVPPYGTVTVMGDVTVPSGVTLEIREGALLLFEQSTGITVTDGGRLVALGTQADRIVMTVAPSATRWDGIEFDGTGEDNRLVCVDMEYGDSRGHAIVADHSRIFLDDMTWLTTGGRTPVMELTSSQTHVRNCAIPTISSGEPIHGGGLSGDQYCIFEGNTFGLTGGYNDIIDFTGGKRPGPIIQMYNNFFAGGGDDALDFDSTDGHVEGNTFMTFSNGNNGDNNSTTSNAVATDARSHIVIARNVFIGGEHHILLKNDVTITAQNNTFVGATMASINFGEPGRGVDPGSGAFLENNIFWNNARIFFNIFDNPAYPGYGPDPMPLIFNSILPSQWHNLGADNLDVDPLFVDDVNDFRLLPGSQGIGSGLWGLDRGAFVPSGASVSGVTSSVIAETEITLTVGGPGIMAYAWRLVDDGVAGPWSPEIALPGVTEFPADPDNAVGELHLTNLEDGHTYHVDVLGKNSAGLWQGERFRDTDFIAPGNPEGNSSPSWTVAFGQQ